MKIIEDISKKIEKEIAMAKMYAECALDVKEEYPSVAETYIKSAENHLATMALNHDLVVAMIADYRKNNGEPPQHMLILYNILHKQHIENAAAVKGMLALYKDT